MALRPAEGRRYNARVIRVVAYIRPHKLDEVKTALGERGITGLTVTEVRGCGASAETTEWFLGEEYVVSLPARIKLEAVVDDSVVEEVVDCIVAKARTGRPGDGKLFLYEEEDAIRIRTGEKGLAAV